MSTYSYQHNSSLDCDNVVYYPSSLQINKFPLNPQNYTFVKSSHNRDYAQNSLENDINISNERNDREHVTLSLKEPQNELISFSIWGRLYVRDVNNISEVSNEDVNNYIEIENIIYNHGERKHTD